MTTNKQVIANKHNALKSTGPVTEGGKAVVAKNALKHGILSKYVVLDTEDRNEYEKVRQSFIDDLQPGGAVEEMLVERIVTCYWRLQRVVVAEQGAIKKKYSSGWLRRVQKRIKKANKYREFGYSYDYKTEKMSNSVFAERAIKDLRDYRDIVEEMGYLPDEARDRYSQMMNLVSDEREFSYFYFFCALAKGEVEGEDKEKGKKALLYVLDKDVEAAEKLKEGIELVEKDEGQAEAMMDMVPDGETIDKLSRYETSLERSMYQAMAMLGKIREGRIGD